MNETPPFFSIIVPTYNRAALIRATLVSILAQDFQNFEVIIVDDGSTDATRSVLEDLLSEKVHYFHKENGERGAARNFGTKQAKGKYVCWFDSDDLMLPHHLTEAYHLIKTLHNPKLIVLSHNAVSPDGIVMSEVRHTNHLRANLFRGNSISCNAMIVRKDIALLHLFNEDRTLSVSEDYELWLRLASLFPMHVSDQITSSIVLHDQRSMYTMIQSERLIARFELFLSLVDNSTSVKEFLGKNYSFFRMKNYLILSADLAASGHKRQALKYLRIALQTDVGALKEKLMYASVKHLILRK